MAHSGSVGGLSEWLEAIGLQNIERSLNDLQIFNTSDLAILLEGDLQDVIVASNFSVREKAIFKVSVRKLQHQPVPAKIELNSEGQKSAKKLLELTKQGKNALTTMETTIEELNENAKTSKKAVSIEFLEIRKKCEQREHELLTEIEQKRNENVTKIKQQCTQIQNALNILSEVKIKTERLMTTTSLEGIDDAQQTIVTELSRVKDVDFPKDPAINSDMRFESYENMAEKTMKHGKVVTYKLIKPPSITKLEASASSIKVSWEHKCEPETPMDALPSGFGIKSTEILENNGDDNLETEFEVDAKTESFDITDLKRNTNYKVELRTKNKDGWSDYGNSRTAKTKNVEFFVGTTLLDAKGKSKLIEFLGGNVKNIKLLFKATINGFGGKDFHKHCDNKGPNVIVVKRNGSPTIFGAYTPLSWKSSGGWIGDDSLGSFVFTMSNDDGVPAKYKHKTSPEFAILCSAGYCPYVSGSTALYIHHNSNTANGSVTNKCNYFGVPTNTTLCGKYTGYTIDDYEVFSVTI